VKEPEPPEQPKKEAPKAKPVDYPKGATRIEVSGCHVLADANRTEMKKWLAERKKSRHSVLWLDATVVADKPLYSAVAAADDRAVPWHAFLDVGVENFAKQVANLPLDHKVHQFASLSGFVQDDSARVAILFHPIGTRWFVVPDVIRSDLDVLKKRTDKQGLSYRLFRPYAGIGGVMMVSVVTELRADRGQAAFDLTTEGLEKLVADARSSSESRQPTAVAACVVDGALKFSAVTRLNRKKLEWSLDTGVTASDLRSKMADKVKNGFRPESLTAYGWDGAVRYCVVWVKEAPKRSR
jgi:hypothetical protein